jgi:hydroxymethylpyrimidine pyrophosphatase-like HAD family hydrolase
MRYHALACDYDGTIADGGVVAPDVRAALARLRASGRRLVLVTGRKLDDLERVCPDLGMFDAIVAENGGVYLRPPAREPRRLGPAPPPALLERLARRGVEPLDRGDVVVATVRPHEVEVVEAIRALGLEMQVVFNKGAVMVLPSGVNKATGLDTALADLGLSRHDVVGIGDGENDHAFLARCELAVAVADAVPSLAEGADVVTRAAGGAGAAEIVDAILDAGDQALAPRPRPGRHEIAIGARDDGSVLAVPGRDGAILCAGTSAGGKSTIVTGFLERLAEQEYQCCIIDPEGDYQGDDAGTNGEAVVLGGRSSAPTVDEVLGALAAPRRNVVANLLGKPLDDRPGFCTALLSRLLELRARCGRPHWIVVDEAHHLFPRERQAAPPAGPDALWGLVVVTVHPEHLSPALLGAVSLVLALGREPAHTLRETAAVLPVPAPEAGAADLQAGEALAWKVSEAGPAFRVRAFPTRAERRRLEAIEGRYTAPAL